MNLKITSRVPWTAKDIIRNKTTGHPYLVLRVIIDVATEVIDLESNGHFRQPICLVPSGYDQFALDRDMQLKDDQFDFQPIFI